MSTFGTNSLTILTFSCCFRLVEVATVADVDAEDLVGNSLLIWELTFGHKA